MVMASGLCTETRVAFLSFRFTSAGATVHLSHRAAARSDISTPRQAPDVRDSALLLFGRGDFCPFLSGLREPNRDRLLASLYGLPTFPTLQFSLLIFVHRLFHGLLRFCSVCGHRAGSSSAHRDGHNGIIIPPLLYAR